MLKRLAFFFALSPLSAFAQVQFDIVSVPVCWNDSSLIKYTYVTTSGAYLDLGYFSPSGAPVTVSGGTVKTGFCVPSDSLSIDSTGRTFTLNIGDQSVSWNAGAEYYAQLLDVDTVGVDTNYIAKYSPSAGGWKMHDNNLDGLTDAIKNTITGNVFAGFINISDSTLQAGAIQNTSFGNGLRRLRTGFNNTTLGFTVLPNLRSGHDDISIGFFTNNLDTSGYETVTIGNLINSITSYNPDSLGKGRLVRDVIIGHGADPLNKISTDEIVIGAYAVGKGDSTVTLGLPFYKYTYLNGNLNLNGYGAGNKLPGLIAKTGSPYLALLATDGTITEIHRDSVGGGGSTTLGGLTDVTLTSPQTGEVLIYNGTDWVNDTVVNTLTATNGVRNAGSLASPEIRLGGSLLENTTITGSGTYSLTIDNPSGFSAVNADLFELEAESATRRNRVAASQFSTVFMESRSLTGTEAGGVISASPDRIRLIHSNNTNTFTRIDIDTNAISLVTPNVRTNTATAGQVLKLVNATTGEVEFAADSTGGGGFTLPTDSITFNDNSLDAVAGKLQRDDNVGTLVYGSPTGVPLRFAGTVGWYVKNQTGAQIDKGTVVRAAGTVGNSDQILIDKMIADGSVEAKFTLGITAEDIANGADGWVFSHGKIKPLDLSAYNQSTVLYVSTTVPGGLTDTLPVAPNLVLPIGFVVDSTANGTLAVRLGLQSTVSASNGLTATVTADNTETKLGGDLTQFTEIDGSNTYGIRFDSLGSFSAFSRGDTRLRSDSTTWGVISNLWFDDLNGLLLETYSSSSLSNTQLFFPRTGQARFRQQRNYNGTNYDNIFQIHEGTTTISALNVDSSNYTELRFTPEKIFLDANTVGSDGWVVTLIDSTTKEIDYRPLNGIEQDTAAAIDFENLPNKIYQFDFTGKISATVSFSNVKTAAVYVIHVLNSNAGDIINWPANCKTETGATLTSTTLAGAGRIFTMYYDGLYYYIK